MQPEHMTYDTCPISFGFTERGRGRGRRGFKAKISTDTYVHQLYKSLIAYIIMLIGCLFNSNCLSEAACWLFTSKYSAFTFTFLQYNKKSDKGEYCSCFSTTAEFTLCSCFPPSTRCSSCSFLWTSLSLTFEHCAASCPFYIGQLLWYYNCHSLSGGGGTLTV